MSNNSSPTIVTDGLIMLLDAANPKSYNPAENLLRYSEQFDNVIWSKNNISITANTVPAPDGTLSADTMTGLSGTSVKYTYQQYTTTATGTYTTSVYLQYVSEQFVVVRMNDNTGSNGSRVIINLINGTLGTISTDGTATSAAATIQNYGNGWYYVTLTCAFTSALTHIQGAGVYLTGYTTTASTGSVRLWGAQLNIGPYARPYTLTTTTARTASTTWTDLTGTGNNVTLANAPTFTGTTFLLNGTSQWAYNNTPLLPTGKLNSTCLCWCLPDSTREANTYVGLVSYGGRTSSNARLMSYWTNTTTAYTSSAYWGNDYVPQATVITLNAWNMVGMQTYGAPTTNNTTLLAGSSQSISYITGNSSNYATGLNTTSINLAVGSTDYPGRYFKGQIAVVMFYNRALTTQEIDQNYDAYRGRFGI